MIDVIAFDADDTLWHNEPYYREMEQNFVSLLAGYDVTQEAGLAVLHKIEVDNLACFGYGVRGFALSMIETAVQVTAGRVRAADIQRIVDLGRALTQYEIRLLDGVQETLTALKGCRLWLITKGDLLDQESKIRRSGLAAYFPVVEVVIDKTPATYAALLQKHAVDPAHFLMVGNSLRSDIAPVLSLGAYAVLVPYPLSWAHESIADLPDDRTRYFEMPHLSDLKGLIERIEGDSNQVPNPLQ
jgi:putative hydrolase of the HAD superfamily